MTRTAFLDETKRKAYMLCAVVVVDTDLGPIRRELARVKGRYSGIHMNDRNDRERLTYAQLLGGLSVEGLVLGTKTPNDRQARDLLLNAIASELVDRGVTRLIIESCAQDREDNRILRNALGPRPAMAYEHRPKSELLLGLPDILGWSHGRGGKFRDAVKPITTDLGLLRP